MDNKAMNPSYSYGGGYAAGADRTRTLFGQVMWLVAATAGFFALGGYAGRNLTEGWAFGSFIAAFILLIAIRFAVSRAPALGTALLFAVGFLLGLAMAPVLSFYASTNPQVLWQSGGATALFIAGFGAAGYATRRDLAVVGRVCFWALIALIVFGIVLIFVHVPGGELIYSILGLVIFAGLTMFDFQRLRQSKGMDSAPLIAASIFLDALNVFLFFLRIFGGGGGRD
jgi:modulator of FtsH protease